jgi:hypothetical protein
MSLLGGLFTRAAKKIAENIRKEVSKVLENLNVGKIDLKTAIAQLERQRQEAISRLSGKKGGKKELKSLLPEIDKQIAELKARQKEIIDGFNEQLAVLRLHSDELSKFVKSWQDINKQIREYIGAGGDAKKAQEFLSLSLRKLREEAIRDLRSGEQEAIQDALQLNDLLEQRISLIEDFKRREFDLMNAGAIERKQANAVRNGQELARLRKEFQDQLDDIDSEITLTEKRLERERTIFDISNDTAELRRRDEELTLIALDEQIQRYRDIKSIIDGISFDSDSGLWQITEELVKLLDLTFWNQMGSGNPNNPPKPERGDFGPGPMGLLAYSKALAQWMLQYGQIGGFAEGGIANEPQLAMVAEQRPEAIIPLRNGFVPVQLTGQQTGGNINFGDINLHVGDPSVNGAHLVDQMENEIRRRYRYGAYDFRRRF